MWLADSDGSSQRTREFRNLRYLRHAINEQTRPKSFFETVLAAASAESRQQSVTSSQEISDIDRSERGVGDASTGKNNKESSPDKAAGEKHVSFDTSSPRAGGPPKLDRRGTEIRLRKELREEKWRKRRSDDEDNAGEVEIIGVAVVCFALVQVVNVTHTPNRSLTSRANSRFLSGMTGYFEPLVVR